MSFMRTHHWLSENEDFTCWDISHVQTNHLYQRVQYEIREREDMIH